MHQMGAIASNSDSYTDILSYIIIHLTPSTLAEIAEGMCFIQCLLFNSSNASYFMRVLCDNSSTKWNATPIPRRKSRHS